MIASERNLHRGFGSGHCPHVLKQHEPDQTVHLGACPGVPYLEPARHRTSFHARINHRARQCLISLPLFFPAIAWGMMVWRRRHSLSTPLFHAPPAGRRLVILASRPTTIPLLKEGNRPKNSGYPPPPQILKPLMDAVFLDILDEGRSPPV